MIEWRADLHCHTTASDGTDSPEKIIDLALQSGLQALSITDHDTIAAYETAIDIASKKKILLLPGFELSTVFKGEAIHILVYGFSLRNGKVEELLMSQKKRRIDRNKKIIQKLKKLGIEIEEKELGVSESTGRPHIAQALIEKGVVTTMKEAFDRYLGEGKAAYDGGERLEVGPALNLIHDCNAKAVLAHPHLLQKKKTLKALSDMPFDGLECYYALIPKNQEEPFVKLAQKKNWLITGGSDYHGRVKPHIPLGASWTPKESFDALYNHFLSQ